MGRPAGCPWLLFQGTPYSMLDNFGHRKIFLFVDSAENKNLDLLILYKKETSLLTDWFSFCNEVNLDTKVWF